MKDQDRLEQIGRAMQQAWSRVKRAQSRMWGDWMLIGEGLLEGRRWAMQQAGVNSPEGRGYVTAFSEWLSRFHVDDMDKSDRAKLLQIMEERPAVEEWRATLSDHDRRNLNNPLIVWRRWTTATRENKARKPGFSANEMGRARNTIEQQQARIEELEQEVAAARESKATPVNPANSLLGLDAGKIVDLILELPASTKKAVLHDLEREMAGNKTKTALTVAPMIDPNTGRLSVPERLEPPKAKLKWKMTSKTNNGHATYDANTPVDRYSVSPTWDALSASLSGYSATLWPLGDYHPSKGKPIPIARNCKTADKAKAAAQKHYDAR